MSLSAKVQEKICHLGDRGLGDGVALGSTPSSVGSPLRLIIHASGLASAECKLLSHCCREALMAGGSLQSRQAARLSTRRFL